MCIQDKYFQYDRIEWKCNKSIDHIAIERPDGKADTVYTFACQPIHFAYDEEGIEHITMAGEEICCGRYTPDFTGVATVKFYEKEQCREEFPIWVEASVDHGYVTIRKRNGKYYTYSDGTPFLCVGINLAFLPPCRKASGSEFGLLSSFHYLGLRQYERWFKKCSANGVNVVRIWLGHDYFCPDTEQIGQFNLVQFSKIDQLVLLAKKYHLKLKLTIEQFRYFNYEHQADSDSYADDVFRKFNKRLYDHDVRCENAYEWLTDPKWRTAWLNKVWELSKRYSGDTAIFAIELWNEMNCVGNRVEDVISWNRDMLPAVKKLFARNMVVNSLGSLDSEDQYHSYNRFCWEESDFIQIHCYLDQGAAWEECHNDPIEAICHAMDQLRGKDRAILIAETGAVNNHHTGPFRYYVNDDDGILFADTVYTPFFCASCGCGNIWHWDERYVEAKNLYRMYRPFLELTEGIPFDQEGFQFENLSTEKVSVLVLKGKTLALCYIRNKGYNWKNVLRDLREEISSEEVSIRIEPVQSAKIYSIWESETAEIQDEHHMLQIRNIKIGLFLKIMFS